MNGLPGCIPLEASEAGQHSVEHLDGVLAAGDQALVKSHRLVFKLTPKALVLGLETWD